MAEEVGKVFAVFIVKSGHDKISSNDPFRAERPQKGGNHGTPSRKRKIIDLRAELNVFGGR